MSRSELFFASVREVLHSPAQEDRVIVQKLPRALIHFNLQQAGSWLLDNKTAAEPDLIKGEPDLVAPDCTLISTESCLFELLSASRSRIMALFMSGKITIRGQHTIFAELRPIFAQASKRMKDKLSQVSSVEPGEDAHHRKVSIHSSGIQFISRSSTRWQPDERAIHCHECSVTFSTFTRKHHCRLCGMVYCHDCSSYLIDGQRACSRCFRSVKRQLIAAMQHRYQEKEAAVAATLPEPTKQGYTIASPPTQQPPTSSSNTLQVPDYQPRYVSTPSSIVSRQGYQTAPPLHLSQPAISPVSSSDVPPYYSSTSSTYTVPASPSPFLSNRLQEQGPPESLLLSHMERVLQAFVHEPIGCTFPHLYDAQGEEHELDTSGRLNQLRDQLARVESALYDRVQSTTRSQIILILLVALISILTTKVPDTYWTTSYEIITSHVISYITSLDIETRINQIYARALALSLSITWMTWCIFGVGILLGLYITWLLQSEWFLLKRRSRIYYVAARVLFGYLWLKYSQKLRKTPEPELTAKWDRAHAKYAALVQHHIVTLQGFWIKVGQYLSSRADVIPEPWIKELSKLQDSVPASSYQHVARVIQEEFGQSIETLFQSFEEEPLAAASIAQVHRAVLKDGTKVVAKVQHPNIGSIMPSDFVNLARITSWVAFFQPDFDFTPVLREWSTEAIKELDFNHECQNMTRVQSNLASSGLNVVLPSIIKGMVSARVIVMTFMDGFKITDTASLDKYGIDRLQLLRRITQAYAHQIYIDGLFNGDPHPGNILVQIHNGQVRPVLLDFGLTKELSLKMREAFAMMVSSVVDANYAGLLESFQHMGLKLKRDDPLEDMRAIRFLLRDTAPPKESRDETMKWRKEIEEKRQKLPAKLRNPIEAWPGELLFLFRVTFLLRGLCSALQIRLPYMSILGPYAKMSLIKRYELHDHAMSIIYPTAVLSNLEIKIRALLMKLYAQGEFVGLQVCVYQREKKIVDTAAGCLGMTDPRPVRPDTLFNGFSVTKGVAAVLLHMLADKRYSAQRLGVQPIEFNQLMSKYWPQFGKNGKQTCTVAQAVSHQAGLQNCISTRTPIDDMIQWDVMLRTIEEATPVTPPGVSTVYHYLAYGFIVGGLIQHVTGRHIRDLVRDRIAMPLGIEHEMMMGLEEGHHLERRLATLCNGFGASGGAPTAAELKQLVTTLREMRAQQQNGNGNVAGAASAFFGPLQPRTFTFDRSSIENKYNNNNENTDSADSAAGAGITDEDQQDLTNLLSGGVGLGEPQAGDKPHAMTLIDPCLFNLSKLRTACIPAANGHFTARALARLYACLANSGEIDGVRLMSAEQVAIMSRIQTEWSQVGIKFGLGTTVYGFEDPHTSTTRYTGMGHSGLGGSLGFCDIHTGVSVAIMVNKLSFHKTATNELVSLIASELGMGQPAGGQLR